MQLDTTIEQRLKELEQVNDEIEQARNDATQLEEYSQKVQIDLLASKLEKSQKLFDLLKFQSLSKRYDEVSTSKLSFFINYQTNLKDRSEMIKWTKFLRTPEHIMRQLSKLLRKSGLRTLSLILYSQNLLDGDKDNLNNNKLFLTFFTSI